MDASMAAAVSALKAQSTALATISNNLANSQTTGYKSVETKFLAQLTETSSETAYPTGGVKAVSCQSLGDLGLISSTATSTNVAHRRKWFFSPCNTV